MGTIEKRTHTRGDGSASEERYRVRYRDAGGVQRSKTFKRDKDAQRFLHQVEADLSRGTYIDPAGGKVLLRDYVATWKTTQVVRGTTAELVDSHLRTWVLPFLGGRRIGSLRAVDIRAFVKHLEANLSPSTVHTVYALLRGMLRQAVDDRHIPSSPCVRIRLPKVERTLVIPLDPAQLARLLDEARPAHRAMIVTAAGAGLRQGEVLGLTVSQVDFLRHTVRVDRQLVTPAKGAPYFAPPKSQASRRTVPVPSLVTDELARHLATFGTGPDDLIFANSSGAAWRRNRFGEAMRATFNRAGLEHATFHDLRHLYASMLIAAGENPKVVQRRLGHASIQETFDTYGHLWPDSDDSTRVAVERTLGPLLCGLDVAQHTA